MATPPDGTVAAPDRRPNDMDAVTLGELSQRTLDRMLEGCQIISRDYRYLYVNEAVAHQGRKQKHELLGRTMMESYPGIEHTQVFSAIARVMTSGAGEHLETEFTFPDGTTGWFELSIQPVPDGVYILSLDISERVRAQGLLNRAQRLESLGMRGDN